MQSVKSLFLLPLPPLAYSLSSDIVEFEFAAESSNILEQDVAAVDGNIETEHADQRPTHEILSSYLLNKVCLSNHETVDHKYCVFIHQV